MSELKPCPFCGSSNTTLDYYEISCPQELGTIVVCNDCGASATSIVDWNTRPIEDALNARIAELEAENDRLQDAWFLDETVCPDGSLRPTVSQLLSRIAELGAENNRLAELLHNELSSLEIATDLGNKRWIALNKIYEDGEKHNANWCKRKAQEGLGIK